MKTPEELAEEFFENWQPEKPKYIRPKARQYALEKVTECFLAGYQAAAPQWISVKDRLPKEDVAVLVYGQVLNDPPDVIGVRRRYNGDQDWKHTWESEDGFIYREDDVTHWMPLPKPPTEE
jgi:hypothetical protein